MINFHNLHTCEDKENPEKYGLIIKISRECALKGILVRILPGVCPVSSSFHISPYLLTVRPKLMALSNLYWNVLTNQYRIHFSLFNFCLPDTYSNKLIACAWLFCSGLRPIGFTMICSHVSMHRITTCSWSLWLLPDGWGFFSAVFCLDTWELELDSMHFSRRFIPHRTFLFFW